jgi:hypothetical protein
MTEQIDYKKCVEEMIQELKGDDSISVQACWIGEPAQEDDIKKIHEALGYTLCDDFLAFYRQCDGLQLKWSKDMVAAPELVTQPLFDIDEWDEIVSDGSINILPLREGLLRMTDGEPFEDVIEDFAETKLEDLHAMAHIDRLDHFYSVSVFLDKVDNPWVSLGEDGDVAYEGLPLTMAAYLELVFLTKGDSGSRVKFLSWIEDPIRDVETMRKLYAKFCE